MTDLGPLQSWVDAAGAIVNAGLAMVVLVSGGSELEPPIEARSLYARLVAILCGIGAGLFWWLGRGQLDTHLLVQVAIGSLGAFVIVGLVYIVVYSFLCLKCAGDATRYLVGLKLKLSAKLVLAGNKSLPPPYGPMLTTPTSEKDYFCNSGRKPDFLWEEWSVTLAAALLCVLYLVVIFAGSMTLTSGAMVLLRPPVEVETQDGKTSLDMPSDVMFAFDKAELESTAEPILARVASILKARKVREATIEGHTDGAGTPSYNQRLSERRASAVYEWLTTKGGMSAIRFHVIGYGATRPRAPNVKPNGADNPDGRLLNRRVEVSFAAGA